MKEQTENRIQVVRAIQAPIQKVFDAWINPRLLPQWGITRAEVDARVGGRYRFETEDDCGIGVHVVEGEYKEFVPNRRIAKTWIYRGPTDKEGTSSLVQVDFRELGPSSTELEITEEGPSLSDEFKRDSGWRAWQSVLDLLDATLVQRAQP